MKMRGHAGFTIVELLIVVVVIGVLAAITIVAYNGIQERARNTAKYQAASNYEKALAVYSSENSAYPPMGAGSVCLGAGYTVRSPDTVGSCGGSDYTTKEDAVFDTAMRSVLSSFPDANNKVVTKENGVTFVGITLTNWSGFTVDGEPHPYVMQFVLEGRDQGCKVPHIVQMIDGEWGEFTYATTQKNTFYDSVSTTCAVALPNP